ncbi:MAG: iron-containing alcohol dehydrogenase [Syntrophomonas sp.]|nr:iron-containing alcohol dehydrogenase [Syntrophomonas sp.]
MNSKFYMRTRIIMGTDCAAKNGELFKTLGKKALIVTGTQSAKKNGAEQDVISALESAGIYGVR